jgi:hypothetical protein
MAVIWGMADARGTSRAVATAASIEAPRIVMCEVVGYEG